MEHGKKIGRISETDENKNSSSSSSSLDVSRLGPTGLDGRPSVSSDQPGLQAVKNINEKLWGNSKWSNPEWGKQEGAIPVTFERKYMSAYTDTKLQEKVEESFYAYESPNITEDHNIMKQSSIENEGSTQEITEIVGQERNDPRHSERVKQIKNLDFNTLQAVKDHANNYATKKNLGDNVKGYYKKIRDSINQLLILRDDSVITQGTRTKLNNKYPNTKESQAIEITNTLHDNMEKVDTYVRENKQTEGGAKRLEEFNKLLTKMRNIINPD